MTDHSHRSLFGSPAPSGLVSGRAADDARERAVRILTDAYAYDVITDLEFERRLGSLGVANTRASIDAVVADLPASGPTSRPTLSPYVPETGRIVGFMSETRRKGPWCVPERLVIRAVMCDMKVDFRYAAVSPGCRIHLTAVMSNVSLIVPPGLDVDFHIDPIMGAAGSDADGGVFGAGPHVHIYGSAIMSEVRVRVRALDR